jgi:CRP/FNR family cyclic AMP-dependent transcriptional regulator
MKADPLKHIPLFTHLSERERRKIAGEVVETCYRKGEFIFREGDRAEAFHILKSGSVKCVKTSADGKEVTMKVLMPGDLFCCDAAVLDGAVHPGCAQPMEDVRVLALNKKAYFAMLRRNPDAALDVIRYLGKRLREAQENAKVLALNPADKRLASLLVNLAARAGVREPGGIRLTVRLTRQDLANMVGVTVETAIRVMSRFARQRLVAGTAKSLIILNLSKLKQLAEAASQPPR